MEMTKQILDQQISDMHKRFQTLDELDLEGKVNNIKQRIFLMKKVINYEDKPKEDTVKVDKAIESKRAEMDKLRQSMQPKKTPVKSLPFNQEDMEMQKADEELKRALAKALDSI